MNILYVALKEHLPGSHGGAVHVLEVARQLARRGHTVNAVVQSLPGLPAQENVQGFTLHRLAARSNYLLDRLEPQVRALIDATHPHIVMERYYNFAGAGVRAAEKEKLPVLLEVNAPMTDPPGTSKARADTLLLGSLTRRARYQAERACRIVTPLAATVPFADLRAKVREIPWGANVELFDPARIPVAELDQLRMKLNLGNRRVIVFSGSFRRWHGVEDLVSVALDLVQTRDDLAFLLVGSGELLEPLRARVAAEGQHERIVFTGAVPYSDVPAHLAVAQIGVAPFQPAYHAPLQVGFYWSPLKVHEYMAMGLPVVTIDVPGLDQIARHKQEGLLYPTGDLKALRAALLRLVDDPPFAAQLGANARDRVVEHFSWQIHAELLEQTLLECLA